MVPTVAEIAMVPTVAGIAMVPTVAGIAMVPMVVESTDKTDEDYDKSGTSSVEVNINYMLCWITMVIILLHLT